MNRLLSLVDLDKIKIPTTAEGGTININSSHLTIGAIVSAFFGNYIFYAAGIVLLIYLITGGFQLMFSKGDPKAIQSAQAKITNALIGFVIVVLAFTIVQLIGQVLGLEGTAFGSIFQNKAPTVNQGR